MLYPKTYWHREDVYVSPSAHALKGDPLVGGHRPLTICDVLAWGRPPLVEGVRDERHRLVRRRHAPISWLTRAPRFG